MKNSLFKKVFGQCYIWLIMIFMYLPILVIMAYSFTESEVIGGKFNFTFNLYNRLFSNTAIMVALGNTILIALISAAVSTFLGTLGAIGTFYASRKWRRTIDMATQIPVVNAEIVIAFSLTVMFVFLGTYVFKSNLFGFWTLLIGHVSLSIPFVYISVKPKLQQMDPSMYEAAIDLGASPRQALTKVVIPDIFPGIMSGFLLSITLSLDDFIITSFTRGAGLLSGNSNIETISTLVQAAIKKRSVPVEIRALTTLIFLAVVVVVVIVSINGYQQEKKAVKGKMRKLREGK